MLLGADPVGDWHNGERWRAALGRSFFALQVTAVQNDSSGWATTIVPASTVLEQDGTLTNLEGRTQRVRAAATAPRGVLEGYAWPRASPSGSASSCRRTRRRPSPTWPPGAPAFSGLGWSAIGERAALGERPAPAGAPAAPHAAAGRDAGRAPSSSATASSCRAQPSTTARRCTSSGAPASRSRTTTPSALGVKPGDRVRVTYDGRRARGRGDRAAAAAPRRRPGRRPPAVRRPGHAWRPPSRRRADA